MKTFQFIDHRATNDHLGFIPTFLSENDPRSAIQQLDSAYTHGGGWRPIPGFVYDENSNLLEYPGDPPLSILAFTILHKHEIVMIAPYAIVCVLDTKTGKYEVARMD